MNDDLRLVSKNVGPMPIVNHYLDRLRLENREGIKFGKIGFQNCGK